MSLAVYLCLAFLLGRRSLASSGGRLLCYDCSLQLHGEGGEQNLDCIYAPEKLKNSVRTCLPHLKACKIVRIEHKDTGDIKSFVRSCSFPGQDSDKINQDYRMIHRYCSTSKCNRGTGIDSDNNGENSRIVALLVKDVEDGGHRMGAVSLVLMASFFFILSLSLH